MTVTYQYFPYETGAGANVNQQEWNEMFSWMRTNGIVTDDATLNASTSDLAVTAGTGLQVLVAEGNAFVQGTFFIQSGNYTELTIAPNTSGNPRIDLVVVSADFVGNTTTLVVLDGTPAGSPVAPTPTQNAILWQLPLAQVAVANNASSIVSGDITDERVHSYQADIGSCPITITSAGGDNSLVVDGTGPAMTIAGLSAGSNITLTPSADYITISSSGGSSSSSNDYCILWNSASVSTNPGFTPITFDTALFDPTGMHDATDTYKIDILVSGLYLMTTSIESTPGSTVYLQVFWYQSSTATTTQIGFTSTDPSSYGGGTIAVIYPLAAGDYIYLAASSDPSSAISSQANSTPIFSAVRIASTALSTIPACKIFNSTSVTVTAGGGTLTLTWDTNIYDPTNMHSTSVNTENVYITTPGLYSISISFECSFASYPGAAEFDVYHYSASGVLIGRTGNTYTVPSTPYFPNLTVVDNFAEGDYIYVIATNHGGDTLTLQSNAQFTPLMSVTYMGTLA